VLLPVSLIGEAGAGSFETVMVGYFVAVSHAEFRAKKVCASRTSSSEESSIFLRRRLKLRRRCFSRGQLGGSVASIQEDVARRDPPNSLGKNAGFNDVGVWVGLSGFIE
jgi:hypothetical protein